MFFLGETTTYSVQIASRRSRLRFRIPREAILAGAFVRCAVAVLNLPGYLPDVLDDVEGEERSLDHAGVEEACWRELSVWAAFMLAYCSEASGGE